MTDSRLTPSEGTDVPPELPENPRTGRRRFVLGALSLSGGGLLLSTGCRGEHTVPTPQEPSAAPPAAQPPEPPSPPGAMPALPEGKDPANFIVHGDSPPTLETRREKLGTSVLTATSLLFVRQNLPLPPPEYVADRDGWRARIEGVNNPMELTVAQLRQLGLATIATVLQCSGNGRKYYEHGPSGSPWGVGAAGCVMWSGVPLRNVVEHLGGLVGGVRYLTTTGGEPLPDGVERNSVVVERSIPIDKAMDDCLLAWEMNGEPLPRAHGGPLRLIVPGYFGCNQIKFVKQLAFTAEQGPAKIQQTGYRMRPIGLKGSPEQPPMWAMPVKSFITTPTDRTPALAGQVRVTGVAFGGEQPVTKVEVSTDGARWQPARFVGPDLGRYAWRVFEAVIERQPGPVTLYSRATRADGETQPEQRLENERGYGNNAWRDMAVTVQVCAPGDAACLTPPPDPDAPADAEEGPRAPVVLSEAGQRGRLIFREQAQPQCATCHTLDDAQAVGKVGPDLDALGRNLEQIEAAVTNGVGAMPPFGKTLTQQQIDDVAQYVFEATRKR
ncbi:MAG: molybdopterin-dependent oxidoreductase [Myxococcales bacterium]|jgi:sulfite dehydrogenase